MLYLSKGVVCKGSTEDKLHIARGNSIFILEGLKCCVTDRRLWDIVLNAANAIRSMDSSVVTVCT